VLASDPAQGNETDVDIAADDAGGAYIVWLWGTDTGSPSKIQHLGADGKVALGWPATGIVVSQQSSQFDPVVTSDGLGGAIVAWDYTSLFAQHFSPEAPVPTLLTLTSAEAEAGQVVLHWYGEMAGSTVASVDRRTETGDWTALGTAAPAGDHELEYTDRSVVAGRYAYRLSYTFSGSQYVTAETWVDVPSSFSLALPGFRPNPAIQSPILSFSLPSADPATLELLDVSGRLLWSREVGSLGAGNHLLDLRGERSLASGIYWVRLKQKDRTLTAKGVVAR
jgi:hypothetical protein